LNDHTPLITVINISHLIRYTRVSSLYSYSYSKY
jgi:hypothetical protein